MEFDQEAVTRWVNLCTEEQLMRESGATNDELRLMRLRILMGMVELLPTLSPIEKSSLLVVLLDSEFNRGDTPLPSTLSDEDRMVFSALLSLSQGPSYGSSYGSSYILLQEPETSDPNPTINDDASTVNDEVCED